MACAKTPCWWRSTWYEHQNLRDERVEVGVYGLTDAGRAALGEG